MTLKRFVLSSVEACVITEEELMDIRALKRPLTRHEVIGAFRRLMLAAADRAPVALIVDDAHLADEATIDLLLHLGSLGESSVLAVLAYRPEPSREALVGGVQRLARGGKAVEIDLGPLDREAAATLVAAGATTPRPPEVVDRIVDLAQGNPFLTLELARSAVAGVPALLPRARDAIASRFLDLDGETVAMLRRLAAAGDALDPVSVVALTGCAEADAFALLDRALAAGILVISDGRYRFRHELVRQTLVEQLTPHQLLAIHRDAARRLTDAGAPRLQSRRPAARRCPLHGTRGRPQRVATAHGPFLGVDALADDLRPDFERHTETLTCAGFTNRAV